MGSSKISFAYVHGKDVAYLEEIPISIERLPDRTQTDKLTHSYSYYLLSNPQLCKSFSYSKCIPSYSDSENP